MENAQDISFKGQFAGLRKINNYLSERLKENALSRLSFSGVVIGYFSYLYFLQRTIIFTIKMIFRKILF